MIFENKFATPATPCHTHTFLGLPHCHTPPYRGVGVVVWRC